MMFPTWCRPAAEQAEAGSKWPCRKGMFFMEQVHFYKHSNSCGRGLWGKSMTCRAPGGIYSAVPPYLGNRICASVPVSVLATEEKRWSKFSFFFLFLSDQVGEVATWKEFNEVAVPCTHLCCLTFLISVGKELSWREENLRKPVTLVSLLLLSLFPFPCCCLHNYSLGADNNLVGCVLELQQEGCCRGLKAESTSILHFRW